MKRILVVLALLVVSAAAFAVSGKIFMRYGTYVSQDPADAVMDTGNTGITGIEKIGPMFSYWGMPHNVDLWQNQPGGTGFEVNFDSFSLLYKTRDPIRARMVGYDTAINTELFYLYDWFDASQRWGANSATADWGVAGNKTPATSPGYFQLKNISLGKVGLQLGLAWWGLNANDTWIQTNGASTNRDYKAAIGYNKFYVDFKFNLPIADNIELKVVDWDLIWTEFYMGGSSMVGINKGVSDGLPGYMNPAWGSGASLTNNASVGGFKIYLPLRLFWTISDNFSLDIGPRLIYDDSKVNTTTISTTNNMENFYMQLGVYVRATYGINDMLAAYVAAGYYTQSEFALATVGSGGSLATNTDNVNARNVIPLYAGLKVKVGPGISMNLGYGANIELNSYDTIYGAGRSSTNTTTWGTQLRNGYLYNYKPNGSFGWIAPERETLGDSIMDNALIKFGADAKFAQNWTLGLAAAVTLNDAWTLNYINDGSYNVSQTDNAGSGGSRQMFNWASFANWMDYDNQMYLKYEDDVVAIKGTFLFWPLQRDLPAGKVTSTTTVVSNLSYGPDKTWNTADDYYQVSTVVSSVSGGSSQAKKLNAILNIFAYVDLTYKF